MKLSDVLQFLIWDVRGWSLFLVVIGVATLCWLNRLHGPIPRRALVGAITVAVPGGCFAFEILLLRGEREPYSLLTFGPALVWVVVGFIALVKSFKLWPLSRQIGRYQVMRILCASIWAVSWFLAWLSMITV